MKIEDLIDVALIGFDRKESITIQPVPPAGGKPFAQLSLSPVWPYSDRDVHVEATSRFAGPAKGRWRIDTDFAGGPCL